MNVSEPESTALAPARSTDGGGRRRNTILSGIEQMLRVRSDTNLTMVRVLLYTAENPGASVGEIADLCRVTDATASRTIRALSREGADGGGPALLTATPLAQDSRGVEVRLSPDGADLVTTLNLVIRRATLVSVSRRHRGPRTE